MAYRRRRGRRGRGRRRGGGFKGKFTYKHRTGRAGPIAELHFYDAGTGGGGPSFLATPISQKFYCLNNVAEGAGGQQRVGRRINMKSILIRFAHITGEMNSDLNNAAIIVRFALVYDAQCNSSGAAPAAQDLFAGLIRSNSTPAYYPCAPLNLNNRDRFLILKDKIYILNCNRSLGNMGQAATVQSNQVGYMPSFMQWYVNLRGLETIFSGTTSDANSLGFTNITTGSLFLFVECVEMSVVGASTDEPGIWNVSSRLRYYD